jgi:hypothetical protein
MSPATPPKPPSRPRSSDGREYPAHLRAYERLDRDLLPLVADLQPVTFDELSLAVSDVGARAALPRWLASAQWRGILDRPGSLAGKPRAYRIAAQTPAGRGRAGVRRAR